MHPDVAKGVVVVACSVILLIATAAGIATWQAANQRTRVRIVPRAMKIRSAPRTTETATYYLVRSQEQADAVQQAWAVSVYEMGLPDLASRHLVVLDSPEVERQFQLAMAGYGEETAMTQAYVVDLRTPSALPEPRASVSAPATEARSPVHLLYYVVGSQEGANRAQLALDTGVDGADPVQPLDTASVVVVLTSPADEAAFRAQMAVEQQHATIIDLRSPASPGAP